MGANNPIEKIILFDGVCNLCSASVRFIIKRDKKKVFRFASLQSAFAKDQLSRFKVPYSIDTIALIKNKKIYFRSDAALEISKDLNGLWPAFYVFKIAPQFIRNAIYNWIAKKRYRWFGKMEECWLPTPELNSRFLA